MKDLVKIVSATVPSACASGAGRLELYSPKRKCQSNHSHDDLAKRISTFRRNRVQTDNLNTIINKGLFDDGCNMETERSPT